VKDVLHIFDQVIEGIFGKEILYDHELDIGQKLRIRQRFLDIFDLILSADDTTGSVSRSKCYYQRFVADESTDSSYLRKWSAVFSKH
jgi:hypothetical protein